MKCLPVQVCVQIPCLAAAAALVSRWKHMKNTWKSSETEGDVFLSEVGVHLKRHGGGSEIFFDQSRAPPQYRRAVVNVESEAQDCVAALR